MKRVILGILILGFLAGNGLAGEVRYWEKWERGKATGIVPPCGINVLPLGGDDILQATVDTYCGINPGTYKSYINPVVMKVYKEVGSKYPDGKTAVLVFKEIGATFTTDHKGGKPIYDVISIKDGKSIASKEKGHPLNPETCANCHGGFKGVCAGYICGNRH
ncbi:MAG: hypothetical protein HY878_03855 [Deltaproteobacteria bacterium]|nr:hypothetical protein [Deltaproteobacteria bacterium]